MQNDVAGLREPGQFQFKPVAFLGVLLCLCPQRLGVRAVQKHEIYQLLVLGFDLGQAALYIGASAVTVAFILEPAFNVSLGVEVNALGRGKLMRQRANHQIFHVLKVEGFRVRARPAVGMLRTTYAHLAGLVRACHGHAGAARGAFQKTGQETLGPVVRADAIFLRRL